MQKDEISEKLAGHPAWRLDDDGQLTAEFIFKNFGQAMLFANAVAHLAESLDHHPDLFIHSYKHVRVSVSSHDVGGITGRDFRLIGLIDALPQRE